MEFLESVGCFFVFHLLRLRVLALSSNTLYSNTSTSSVWTSLPSSHPGARVTVRGRASDASAHSRLLGAGGRPRNRLEGGMRAVICGIWADTDAGDMGCGRV